MMKKYIGILALILCMVMSGCGQQRPVVDNTTETQSKDRGEPYFVVERDGFLHSYKITSKQGNILLSEDQMFREPKVEQIGENVCGVTVQTGTGLSTNWAKYCNIETEQISEVFYYVLYAQENYVFYVDYRDGQHSIVVENIFDRSAYRQVYELENCSPVAADVVQYGEPSDEGTFVVTYLTGEDYTETTFEIPIPD